MKIGIMGAGAIGGLIGGYLKKSNFDITLIDSWHENIFFYLLFVLVI